MISRSREKQPNIMNKSVVSFYEINMNLFDVHYEIGIRFQRTLKIVRTSVYFLSWWSWLNCRDYHRSNDFYRSLDRPTNIKRTKVYNDTRSFQKVKSGRFTCMRS